MSGPLITGVRPQHGLASVRHMLMRGGLGGRGRLGADYRKGDTGSSHFLAHLTPCDKSERSLREWGPCQGAAGGGVEMEAGGWRLEAGGQAAC